LISDAAAVAEAMMGVNFVVANPRKRQFFDPSALLDNSNSTGVTSGLHLRCVALLCSRNVAGFGRGVGVWDGAWFADPIYLVGDGSDPPLPPEFDFTPDGRDLWSFVHDEFEDISYPMLAALCESDDDLCSSLAAWAKAGISTALVHLGNAVNLVGCEPLRKALDATFGREWAGEYGRAYLQSSLGRAAAERRTRLSS
jgi:hypothetical protein